MKNNIFKAVFAVLAAAAVLVGCTAKQTPSAPKATLTADASFVNGSANLTVALSEASSSEVTVTLAVSGTLPEANLTWNPVVKIAAGSKQASVPVTAKADGLEAGTYAAKFSIKAASGAEVGSPAEASVNLTVEAKPEDVVPEVSISKYDDAFTDGKATITLALSVAASADVKVNFALGTEVEEGSVIAADALTFENPATIKAGETSKVVEISLDLAKIAAGTNWAIISIENAEGATVGKKNIAYIEAEGSLRVFESTTFTVEYYGNYDYTYQDGSVETLDAIMVYGIGNQPFIMNYYTKGTVASALGSDEAYVEYMYENINNAIAQGATADDLDVVVNTGTEPDYGILFNLFDPGEYEVYVLACDENGVLTGEYATSTFEVTDPEEATEAYTAWVGAWKAGDLVFYIQPKWNNKSFDMYGFEPIGEDGSVSMNPVTVDYDAENDLLALSFGMVDSGSKWGYYMAGIDNNNYVATGGYTKPGTEAEEDEDEVLATIANKEGTIQIAGHTTYFTYQGTDYVSTPQEIGIYGYNQTDGWARFTDMNYLTLPAEFVKQKAGAPQRLKVSSLSLEQKLAHKASFVPAEKPVANKSYRQF